MSQYKAILFDMGNVLMDFSPDYVLSQYVKDAHEINKIRNALFFSPHWVKSDKGIVSDEVVLEHVILELGESYRDLILYILKTWYHYKTQNRHMIELVKQLKKQGYQLYLCSNAANSFHLYEKEIEALRYFDGKVISADIKLVKPHREYFEYVLHKYNLKAEECFFIDDSIENIKGASLCGIDGYWYNGNSYFLQKYLKGVNIIHE